MPLSREKYIAGLQYAIGLSDQLTLSAGLQGEFNSNYRRVTANLRLGYVW